MGRFYCVLLQFNILNFWDAMLGGKRRQKGSVWIQVDGRMPPPIL